MPETATQGTSLPSDADLVRTAFELDGERVEVEIEPSAVLIDVIRELGRTAPKEGCGVGVCGACTVLLDDRPVSSCLYFAAAVDGCGVWTADGLQSRFPEVHEAFIAEEAMQCGICTPGQVTSVCALKIAQPAADEDAVRDFLNGNLCRCTGYQTILRAAMTGLRDE